MTLRSLVALMTALLIPVVATGQAVYDQNREKEPGAQAWLTARAKLAPFTAPRNPDGTPNLQGRWGGSASGDDIEATEYIDITTPAANTWVAVPADGKVPYQPWALAERNAHRAGLSRGWPGESGERLHVDPQTFCLKTVPRYAQRGFELAQQPGYAAIMLNWGHYFRSIPIKSLPHAADTAAFWMGNPRGRWDGDTLVVETANLNGKMWLDSVGNFYTEHATVTERFTLVHANILDYQVTIDDPTAYTQPMVLNYALYRVGSGAGCPECGGPGGGAATARDPYAIESWEHACHEGNGQHVIGARELGFQWYLPPSPPAR